MDEIGLLMMMGVMLLLSFGLSAGACAVLLPLLRKLKAGQSIREEGPKSHQVKAGTPTMGGLSFVIAFCVIFLVGSFFICKNKNAAASGLYFGKDAVFIAIMTLIYAGIGFLDDFIKVVKKRNLGLTAKQKIALQIIAAVVAAIYGGLFSASGTTVYIPFARIYVDFGWFYYPFVVFMVLAMTNAVNLTDGLDGLAGSVTSVVCIVMSACCIFLRGNIYAPGAVTRSRFEAATAAMCLCGAIIGFLLFNLHPAKVFMGDTGSLALGGSLAAIAIVSGKEFILPLAGLIYVIEALSVIIQVFVFKTQNGRRFFRMAPIHHHFELGGMHEESVVWMFTGITIVLGILVLIFA